MSVLLASRVAGYAASALFAAATLIALYRYFSSLYGADKIGREIRETSSRGDIRRVICVLIIAFVVSRVLLLAGGALAAWQDGNLEGYLSGLPDKWTRWDANHYIGLIENWYVDEGDPRFHIVFFPLYPAICRIVRFSTGLSATASAYIVSNAAFFGCGMLMYLLVSSIFGHGAGMRAAILLMFSPLTLFCSIPYTESVFLLTTLAAVYCARKRKFLLAVIFGALSANARLAGMATAIPIFWEMLSASELRGAKKYVSCVLRVLPVALGLAAYIGLNYAVTGDAFKFLEYQRDHWSQTFGSVHNTVGYTLRYAFEYENLMYRAWLWMPQLIVIFVTLAIMLCSARRQRPSDMAYGVVYSYVSLTPTWLLSGSRYLTAMYSLYPALALLARNKWVFRALVLVFAALCVAAGAGYSVKGYIL